MPSLYTHINKTDETTILDMIIKTNKIFYQSKYISKQSLCTCMSLQEISNKKKKKKINILKFF